MRFILDKANIETLIKDSRVSDKIKWPYLMSLEFLTHSFLNLANFYPLLIVPWLFSSYINMIFIIFNTKQLNKLLL